MLMEILRGRRRATTAEVLEMLRVGFGSLSLLKAIDLGTRLTSTDLPLPTATLIVWTTAAVLVIRSGRGALVGGPVILGLTLYIYFWPTGLTNQHMYLLGWIALVVWLSAARAASLVLVSRSALILAIRIQATIVYAFSFATKITEDFLAGLVVAMFTTTRPVGLWLGLDEIDVAWPFIVVSVLAMSTEGVLAVGLWSRRWWRQFFALGFVFHLSLLVFMAEDWVSLSRLGVFGGLVMLMYVAFLPTVDETSSDGSVSDGSVSDGSVSDGSVSDGSVSNGSGQAPTDRRMPIT